MSYSAFLLTLVIPLLILMIMLKKKKKKNRLPPGPNKLPILGNLHQLTHPLHKSLARLSDVHGPLMFLQLGSVPALVISSPAVAKAIFKTHDLVFASRPVLYVANKLSYNASTVSFAPYGEYWREIKKIAVLELLSAKRVQSFEAVREQELELMIKTVTDSSSKSCLINLSELMYEVNNNVVLRVVFDKKGISEFNDIIHETEDLLGTVNIADSFPLMGWYNKLNGFDAKLEKNFRDFDDFFDKVIQEHRERRRFEHEDLLDVLLRLQNDPNQKIKLTDDHIKAVLKDIFIAGSDASASTLVWTMTELIKNPAAMRKAQEEVRGVVKGQGGKVKESHLPKLTYLKMIIKEALRLHPPGPLLLPRETTESCSVQGYDIPAKTRVFVNVEAMNMDPEYWENPKEFKPERFLNNSIDYRGQHFELLPFGAGRRSCPGVNFAVMIIEITIANLLYSFDWSVPDGMTAQDIDMEESSGIALYKKNPLCLVASPVNHYV